SSSSASRAGSRRWANSFSIVVGDQVTDSHPVRLAQQEVGKRLACGSGSRSVVSVEKELAHRREPAREAEELDATVFVTHFHHVPPMILGRHVGKLVDLAVGPGRPGATERGKRVGKRNAG